MKTLKNWLAAAALVALSGGAQAALIARAGDMVYDDVLNITWLSDWNHAKTQWESSGGTIGDADGRMIWSDAVAWAGGLVYGGYDDWRLPTSLNADGTSQCGQAYGCSGSEMGHMFYNNWGATAGFDFSSGTNAANLALFSNVQSYGYWSGTVDPVNPDSSWAFFTFDGSQEPGGNSFPQHAVAVRTGDVGASVPEPQTLALTLLALGAALLARRRQAG
jgi:hypothetical protein